MSSTTQDYTACMAYPMLDVIHHEPTFLTLKTMKAQLKENAIAVTSDLGGGQFGHLGLVLTPPEYALISAVPYVPPRHPYWHHPA